MLGEQECRNDWELPKAWSQNGPNLSRLSYFSNNINKLDDYMAESEGFEP
jgi:hypothetical protein